MWEGTHCPNGWGVIFMKTLLYLGWDNLSSRARERARKENNYSSFETDHDVTGP